MSGKERENYRLKQSLYYVQVSVRPQPKATKKNILLYTQKSDDFRLDTLRNRLLSTKMNESQKRTEDERERENEKDG